MYLRRRHFSEIVFQFEIGEFLYTVVKNLVLLRMKKLVFCILIMFLYCGTGMAQSVKLIKSNLPEVVVDNKRIEIGESFSTSSTINWVSPKQVIIVRDSSGKLVRLSASLSASEKTDIVGELVSKSVQHLTSREMDDMAGGDFIIEDTLMIPTYMEEGAPVKARFVGKCCEGAVETGVVLSPGSDYAIIDAPSLPQLKHHIVKGKIIGITTDGETFDITDTLNIIPIDLALKEQDE